MDFIPTKCAARSLGPTNQLIGLLIQTLLNSYCEISNPGWPQNCGNPIDGEYFDFIIVGAGTSGSVVAGRLSENPNFKILVLEAGGDPPVESEIPGMSSALQKSPVDWQYYANAKHACLAFADKKCYFPRGKMIGGTSGLNYMFYGRGNKQSYDYWSHLGNTNWDYEHVFKYFKRWEGNRDPIIANYDHGHYHNKTGPVNVKLLLKYPRARVFLHAAKERGNKKILDINADKTLGYFDSQGFDYDGVRQSAAKSYLIPAKNRPNLCIRKYSHVYKILFDENKRAIGVQYNYNGTKNFTVHARKEIILSAGTIESAHLLLLSGIGPKEELDRFNLPTISDLPVGKNMYDRVSVLVFIKFSGKPQPSTETLDDAHEYLIHRGGPLSSNGAIQLMGFVNTRNSSRWPDAQYAHIYFPCNSSALAPYLQTQNFEMAIQEKLMEVNKKWDIGIALVVIIKPKSIGSVSLKSASYLDYPEIDANYLDNPDDEDFLIRAVERQVSYETTEAFKKRKGKFIKLPLPACDGFEFKSRSYFRCYNRHFALSPHHAVGTSKMGPKCDPTSVVSQKLLVRGVTCLSQADLGVAPYVPSANTNAAALMIGEKAASLITKRHS